MEKGSERNKVLKETGCGVEKQSYGIHSFVESLLESRPPIFLSNTPRFLFSVAQRGCWSKTASRPNQSSPDADR